MWVTVLVVGVWDSYMGYCTSGVWDSYMGYFASGWYQGLLFGLLC